MIVGVPTEVKNNEFRVGLTASGVHELVSHGHQVVLQQGAGEGSSIPDHEYIGAGAQIVEDAADVWERSDLIVKVKEPVPDEYGYLREGLGLFTYLHLAADRELTETLISSGVTAIAYETVQSDSGQLPLLAPMSEVAGRYSVQAGAHFLSAAAGGMGILLGGVPGVRPARVVVLGAGVAGTNAAAVAVGLGASVTILDLNLQKLTELDARYAGRITTIASNQFEVARCVADADLVIGAVLIPGAKAPRLVSTQMVSRMRPGSVLVDIAIDQGGCFEDSRPTTHEDPVYAVKDSLFYCVANMPGAVPNTSTYALANATLHYLVSLADHGLDAAVAQNPDLARGLNVSGGQVRNGAVARAHGLPHVPLAGG